MQAWCANQWLRSCVAFDEEEIGCVLTAIKASLKAGISRGQTLEMMAEA